MIVYGTGSKKLKESEIQIECPNCQHDLAELAIYQRYFDLFWIPTFPIGELLVITCSNCKAERSGKTLPDEIRSKEKSLKSTVSTPKYMFSGLAVILGVIMYFSVQASFDESRMEEYINTPQVEDVYAIYDEEEESEFKYYFFKVSEVSEDSIFVRVNEYMYNMIPETLEADDGFYDIEIGYTKEEITNMYNMDEIRSVFRDYSESMGFSKSLEFGDELYLENFVDSVMQESEYLENDTLNPE